MKMALCTIITIECLFRFPKCTRHSTTAGLEQHCGPVVKPTTGTNGEQNWENSSKAIRSRVRGTSQVRIFRQTEMPSMPAKQMTHFQESQYSMLHYFYFRH